MIEKFLQGAWLKHPLHPALVHIPVSLWISSSVFDLFGLTGIADSTVMARLAFYAISLGLLLALLAIPTGLADWYGIRKENPAWMLGIFHMVLNWIASLAFTLSLGLRSNFESPLSPLPILISLLGVLILLVSAYLGGRMSYGYGISVARHSKQYWKELAVKGKANVPSEEGGSQNA